MIYLRKNKKDKYKKNLIVLSFIAILLLLWFFGNFFKNLVHIVANPVLNSKNFVVDLSGNFLNYFASKQEQANQISRLEEENKKLKLELLTLDILKNENRELRDILRLEQEEQDFYFAEVLIKPPFSPYDTFVIEIGQNNVSIGNKIFFDNVLLGEIIEVYKNTAVVKLYSSSDKKIPVLINDKIEAEALGQGAYNFLIILPKSTEIEIGAKVTTLEGNYVLGVVQNHKPSEANTFSDILISYPVNPNSIDVVKIQKND